MTGTWDRIDTGRVLAALLALAVALTFAARALSTWPDAPEEAGATATEEEEHEGRAPTEIELTPAVEAAFR